jgi:glycolate oxidase
MSRCVLPPGFVEEVSAIVGPTFVHTDADTRARYGVDALKRGSPADVVVLPASTDEVAAILKLANRRRVPVTPRGGGTGYTGGAVPVTGGVVLSLERLNQILHIDEESLYAVVQPNVVTGDLQEAVERRGLFYPPDPASLRESAIGGNVAENAGGPRAFKYGVTSHWVLGLQAVLATGDVIRTGGKTVKNVVGYDLTRLLVGSEGTLAVITEVTVRLVPKPPVQSTLRATFPSVTQAVAAVTELIRRRVVPAAIELVDGECLEAVARYLNVSTLAPPGTAAALLVEVDGLAELVAGELARVEAACRAAGATEILRAETAEARQELWRVRRELSPSLKVLSPLKYNHDVVVPKGRIPELFRLVDDLKRQFALRIPCFGHVGDGNIHVNIVVDPDDAGEQARAHRAERALFEGVVAMGGSISGEHGIGFAKAKYLGIELSAVEIALMRRIKHAFDPNGILNPGKIFPDEAVEPGGPTGTIEVDS